MLLEEYYLNNYNSSNNYSNYNNNLYNIFILIRYIIIPSISRNIIIST